MALDIRIRAYQILALIILVVWNHSPALSQSAVGKRLSLTEAIETVRQQHPMMVASKQRLAIAEAEMMEAGLRPNPSLTISGENFPVGPVQQGFNIGSTIDWFATYTQTFETAGKRQLRVAFAERNIEAAQAEAVEIERRLVFEVKAAYQLVAIRKLRLELLRENLTNLNQLVSLNEIRVREGYTSEGDLIKIRLEAQRFEYQMHRAELELETSRIGLLRAIGASSFENADLAFDISGDLVFQPVAIDAMQLQRSALDLPQVKAAQSRVDRAEALIRLEEARVRPDITATIGYKRNGPDNALFAGVNIPLQLFNRNQAMLERSRAELEMAQAELRNARNLVLSDLTAARRVAEMNQRQVESMRADFLMRADESRNISLAAYREGAVDLLVLLDAQRVRSQTQDLYFQALYDFKVAVHDLERAAGIDTLTPQSTALSATR